MLYRFFLKAMSTNIIDTCKVFPRNLRQYYADQLMLMKIELEYGVN